MDDELKTVYSHESSASEQRFNPSLFPTRRQTIVVDAGSRHGGFCLPFAVMYPRAHIVCIEPEEESIRRLRTETMTDIWEHMFLQVVPRALWYKKGEVEIFFWVGKNGIGSPQNSVFNKYPSEKMPPERKQPSKCSKKIKTVTLQDILDHFYHIDLLKMNIEGAEWDIIRHTPKKVFKNIHQVTMECHCGYRKSHSFEKMIKLLETKGYQAELIKEFEWEQGIIYGVQS